MNKDEMYEYGMRNFSILYSLDFYNWCLSCTERPISREQGIRFVEQYIELKQQGEKQ